ncbi:MAG: acylneuraminate cytidylyltransferase family protein [Phycisphaeraceae bacterium]|nr:acylneuraminate cytidylyltransferase family protein [Phycisphaeraceae bacterium]
MKAVAVILGRAGSKGVPGKNTAPIAGKPCVQWTIEAAKASEHVAHIIVSSDDPVMLELAEHADTIAMKRPAELASDGARVDDAARHAIREFERTHENLTERSPIVILYANVPVRPPDLIDRAVHLLRTTECDSVQSYAPVGKHHPWWTAKVDQAGKVSPWEGEVLNHGVFRRQDLPPAFVPDGGIIALTRRALFLEVPGVPAGPHAFFGKDRRGVVNPEGTVIDIDAPTDLLVADAILRERNADR